MTQLLFWDDTYLAETSANIETIKANENNKNGEDFIITVDKTVFHPQGGGQPSDTGTISNDSFEFTVVMVRKNNEIVEHYGNFTRGNEESVQTGTSVNLSIHLENRKLYARLHSAGHLLDAAVKSLGLELIPGKGYHFPNSPYVEYKGGIPADKRTEIKQKLNESKFTLDYI